MTIHRLLPSDLEERIGNFENGLERLLLLVIDRSGDDPDFLEVDRIILRDPFFQQSPDSSIQVRLLRHNVRHEECFSLRGGAVT